MCSDGYQAGTVCERVLRCGALVAVGSSRWEQQSLSQKRLLILEYNIKYVLLACHGQIRVQYPLLPVDLSFYISSKKLSYAKLLVRARYWESAFAFHLSR